MQSAFSTCQMWGLRTMESSLGVGLYQERWRGLAAGLQGNTLECAARGEVELKCTVDRTSYIVCGIPLCK